MEFSPSAGFQGNDSQHVVNGHDEGNHHGGNGKLAGAEDIAYNGNAQQHEVAAEDGLGHGAPPYRHFLFQGVGRRHAEDEKGYDSQGPEDDELWAEG